MIVGGGRGRHVEAREHASPGRDGDGDGGVRRIEGRRGLRGGLSGGFRGARDALHRRGDVFLEEDELRGPRVAFARVGEIRDRRAKATDQALDLVDAHELSAVVLGLRVANGTAETVSR